MIRPEELQSLREDATRRFLAVAQALKQEAGVTAHEIVHGLYGNAWAGGRIKAPEGRTRKQLYILAHECAHIALKHDGSRKPVYIKELEAELWAHAALRRHGISVPRDMTDRARTYVGLKIQRAQRRGVKTLDPTALAFAHIDGR